MTPSRENYVSADRNYLDATLLLAVLLVDDWALEYVAPALSPQDFADARDGQVFAALVLIHAAGGDISSVYGELPRHIGQRARFLAASAPDVALTRAQLAALVMDLHHGRAQRVARAQRATRVQDQPIRLSAVLEASVAKADREAA